MRPMSFVQRENYKAPRKGRRFAVLLTDFFTTVIMTFVFFAGVLRPIYDNMGSTGSTLEQYAQKGREILSYVDETRLQPIEDEDPVPLTETAEEDLRLLVRTSYFHYGLDYTVQDQEGHLLVEDISMDETTFQAENDDLRHYVFEYRPTLSCFQEGEDSYRYLNEEFLDLDSENSNLVAPDFDLNSVFVLSKENAVLLHDFLEWDETGSRAQDLHDQVVSLYIEARQKGIQEVEDYDLVYQRMLESLTDLYQTYMVGQEVTLLLSYLLAFLFTYVLFPAIFRHGRTISDRLFGLALCDMKPRKVPFYKHLARDLILFLTHFWALFFPPLFLSMMDLLSVPLLGPITLFQLVLFSFLLFLLSIVVFLVLKDGQTLEELATMTYTVDLSRPEEESVFSKEENASR